MEDIPEVVCHLGPSVSPQLLAHESNPIKHPIGGERHLFTQISEHMNLEPQSQPETVP